MRLEQISDGPSASGQSFKESNPDAAHTLKEHEVVEFEPDRAIVMLTQDGPAEIRGHTTFEAVGHPQTVLTMTVRIRSMDESLGGMMTGANQNSLKISSS
jgi:hypothetical protein